MKRTPSVIGIQGAQRRRAESEACRLAGVASRAIEDCAAGDYGAAFVAGRAVNQLVRLVLDHRLDLPRPA